MSINVRYFASLREQSEISSELIKEDFENPLSLFQSLSEKYHFTLKPEQIKASVNGTYQEWDYPLKDGDLVVFIPPVAGG